MKTREDFYEMIERRKEFLSNRNSDCFGTALFLVGEKNCYNPETEPEKYLSKLKKADEPEVGYLIDWEDRNSSAYHLAVVKQKDPLTLMTKNGRIGSFYEDQPFEETDYLYDEMIEDFGIFKERNNFYVPSKLQKILDVEESKKWEMTDYK